MLKFRLALAEAEFQQMSQTHVSHKEDITTITGAVALYSMPQ